MKSRQTLDRRLGKWLLHRLNDFSPAPYAPRSAKKAVLFIPRLIGDGMATFPALRALQAAGIPHIIVVASQSNQQLFAPLADQGEITLETIPSLRAGKEARQLAHSLRKRTGGIDLCIDASLKDNTSSINFIGALKARNNIQMSGSPMRCYAPVSAHAVQMYEDGESVPLCWATLMRDAHIADVPARFELPVPEAIDDEVASWIGDRGPYIALNLDGSTDDKKLSIKKAELIAQLAWEHYQLPVVLLTSPTGESKAKQLANQCSRVTLPELPRTLQHSAALVHRSALTISPDTALVHAASAHNVPVIGIYRAHNGHWVPLSEQSAMIIAGRPIEQVTEEQVEEALGQVPPSLMRTL